MHHLVFAGGASLSAAEIGRAVQDRITEDTREAGMRHLLAIERLAARGARYANEDFDVLSAAWRFASEGRLTAGA